MRPAGRDNAWNQDFGALSGLLDRAVELRDHELAPPPSELPEGMSFEEDSGISREDQREILTQIEQVASENKITVTPDVFTIRALKKGVLFPALVNVFSVLLLAAGLFTLYTIFRRGETQAAQEGTAITTAEGTLIKELKKESQEQLLAKNREIAQIQTRMQEIDQERNELATNMEARVRAREEELRRALQAELDGERARLKQQGVSEEDISARLRELETQKTADFQRQMAAFRQEAEAERRRSEENLKSLQTEYQASLQRANAERQRVLEDARRREEELRGQMEARTQALQRETQALQRQTQAAREELNRIAAQREQEQLASNQLVGLYAQVRSSMQKGNLEGALQDLGNIREYLNTDELLTLPNIVQRRDVELFVVDSITSLVKTEMERKEADTTSLIAATNVLTDIRSRVAEGDALVSRGEAEQAERKYREALATLPAIDRSVQFLEQRKAQADARRREQLDQYIRRAEESFAAGDYAATLVSYTRALAYLPEDSQTIERMITQARQSGFALGMEGLKRQESAEAAAPLQNADSLLAQGSLNEALLGYIDVVARYPHSPQAQTALLAIRQTAERKESMVGGESAGLRQQLTEAQARQEELEKSLAERTSELEAARQSLDQSGSELAAARSTLQERTGELEQSLQARLDQVSELQRQNEMLTREVASLKEQIVQLQEQSSSGAPAGGQARAELSQETEARISRLEKIAENYDAIVRGYREYTAQEDRALAAKGEDAGLLESKLYLNAFLASSESAFPGLWERIKRYDTAFEKAGRSSALQDVSDILYELSLRDGPQERRQFLDAEQTRLSGDSLMTDLIGELKEVQGSGSAGEGGGQDFNGFLDQLVRGGRVDTRQMSLLDELALRTSPESRALYLQAELLRYKDNEEMTRLLQDLLGLVRSSP